MKSETEMIVDAAETHLLEGLDDHLKSFGLGRTFPIAKEKRQIVGRWELRRRAETAALLVEATRQLPVGSRKNGFADGIR